MESRLRSEAGVGLIELLIAMTVLSIAIFALVAGLSSGFDATRRAGKASTAATLADERMESYRRGTYALLTSNDGGGSRVAADGRTYHVSSVSTLTCIFGGVPDTSVTPATCPPDANGLKNRPLTTVTVTVRDGSAATDPVLITQTSTFDQSTGTP